MTSVTVTKESACNLNKSRVSKTEIRLATVDEMLAQANVLFEEHYEEIALNKQVMKLKPDEKAYRNLEEANRIFILSAWQDDVLIGYSVNFVLNHPHYADLVVTQNDLLYIKKEMRGTRAGLIFIIESEIHAKSLGCKLMLWHAKENTSLCAILPRLKYGVQDIVYSKEL